MSSLRANATTMILGFLPPAMLARYHSARALFFWWIGKRPGDLDHTATLSRVPRFGESLLAPASATPIRRACEPRITADRPIITQVT